MSASVYQNHMGMVTHVPLNTVRWNFWTGKLAANRNAFSILYGHHYLCPESVRLGDYQHTMSKLMQQTI
jgi:hypothetical protein